MSLTIKHADHVTVQIGSSSAGRDFLASLLGSAAGGAIKATERATTTPMPSDAAAAPVKPGELWVGHGWYAGVCCAPDGARWHLLLSENEEHALADRKWGDYGTEIAGADSIYDGQANTVAMAAAGNALAKEVQALGEGMYLPSRAEALLLFATLKDRIGGGYVWTSTQSSAHNAWCQGFGDGYQYIYSKDYEFRAVAVRRLML